MSPVSKSRKKKQQPSGRRSEDRSPLAPLLAAAAGLLETNNSLIAAELWASELHGSAWLGAWQLNSEDPLDVFEDEFLNLVDALAELRQPEALMILRALSGVGEKWSRLLAHKAAGKLAAAGVPEPSWYAPDVALEFVSAGVVTDLLGDLDAVALGFRRGDAEYTLLFMIQAMLGIGEIQLFGTPDEGLEALLHDLVDSTDGTFRPEVTPLTADQAYLKVWPWLDEYLDEEPDEGARAALLDEDGDEEHPIQVLALALAWLEPLEPDEAEPAPDFSGQVAPVVEAFLASSHAQGLDPFAARRFAEIAAEAAVQEGRSPDAYGPLSLTGALVEAFAAAVHITDEDLALFPDLVRAWAYFTSDHRNLPPAARACWDEALPDVLADFTESYADRVVATHRKGQFRP